MTTAKQVAANRANAKQSTGPKTALGKIRASRNALSHGLSAPFDVAQTNAALELAAFIEANASIDSRSAVLAATSQFVLANVRLVRRNLMKQAVPVDPVTIKHLAATMRYEKRAKSAHKRAMMTKKI